MFCTPSYTPDSSHVDITPNFTGTFHHTFAFNATTQVNSVVFIPVDVAVFACFFVVFPWALRFLPRCDGQTGHDDSISQLELPSVCQLYMYSLNLKYQCLFINKLAVSVDNNGFLHMHYCSTSSIIVFSC
jgi:hypothetical protein